MTAGLDVPTSGIVEVPLGGGKDGETVQFRIGEEFGACRLRASYREQFIDTMGPDFFAALCQVRGIMALSGLHPICYGASLDVYCIDSIRQTGKGLTAYQLTMGLEPRDADMVGIFAYGPDVCPSTVVDQKRHYQSWLDSLPA